MALPGVNLKHSTPRTPTHLRSHVNPNEWNPASRLAEMRANYDRLLSRLSGTPRDHYANSGRLPRVADVHPWGATPRTTADAPASVSVIGRDDILRRPVQDLSDVLRDTPGVTINGAGLTRRGVSIRGMPSEHTLFLLDGRRVNAAANAVQHADFDLGWVPAEAIERVEVVRGVSNEAGDRDTTRWRIDDALAAAAALAVELAS